MLENQLKKAPKHKGHPIFGNTMEFAKGTLSYIEKMINAFPEGIVKSKIAFRDFYILLKPEYIQQVLVTNNKHYEKSFAYEGLMDFLGKGLLTNEGEFWLNQRRQIQPAFHKEKIANLANMMIELVESKIEEWERKSQKELHIQPEMIKLTKDIISIALFGKENYNKKSSDKITEALAIFRKYANDKMKNPFKPPLFIPTAENSKFKKAKKSLQLLIFQNIENCRKRKDFISNTILGMFFQTEEELGKNMTTSQLYDEIVTIYIAGQETTSNALTFIFYLIATHPNVEKKLMDELENNELSDQMDFKTMLNLTYTRYVIMEALRLYPPAWAVSRKCITEDHIDGYKIPKGSTIFLSVYAMQRHKEYWDKPNEFIPERFAKEYNKKAYLPFGLGPRICIGNEFAMLEIQIIVALILKNFKISLPNKKLELITPMTLSPKNQLIFQLEKRNSILTKKSN
ncbi:MAG: cytochrome P450 [Flammeovirgaceae bacterium]|nr:cytochrome P450 [Flammeovirgaceae bacterium]